jgi:hypothetical protein
LSPKALAFGDNIKGFRKLARIEIPAKIKPAALMGLYPSAAGTTHLVTKGFSLW